MGYVYKNIYIWEEKSNNEIFTLLYNKTYSKAIVIKIIWAWCKSGQTYNEKKEAHKQT